ncbi:MAG: hypothetical protein E7625_02605 [Ruminococcaceae bacterium]|nr:hypothetical protein [Oscillospiraceae bacterium]
MRIIGLHVQNFGGLCDHTETFEEGLNLRLHPNGWGKSTLAVFIKAMLYGLPATTKRSLIENERKRYSPWNGGAYGGSLDIEVGGEAYRIERFFGAKEAEDRLNVLSLRTGAEADTEWASNPGEGLFGVDAAAYERSTYLSQRPDDMTRDGTVSIHTKLNRLVDATDDLANYDRAMELLEKRRRELHHLTGGGGEIAAATARHAALTREIERCYAQRTVLSACRNRINDLKENMVGARAETEQIQQELSSELKRREGRAIGARMAALEAEEAELNTFLANCREVLGGQEPTEQLIETVTGAAATCEEAKRRLDRAHPDEEELAEIETLSGRFDRGLPTEEQLEALRHAAKEYNRASVLAMDLEDEHVSVEPIDPEEQFLQARAHLQSLRDQRQALAQSETQGKTRRIDPISAVMLALSVVFIIVALWVPLLWIVSAVCLAVALIFAALHAKRHVKAAVLAQEGRQKITQLDGDIKQAELRLQAAESALRFAGLWRATFVHEPCPGATEAALCIERLAAQGERLVTLLEKKKQIESAHCECRRSLDEAQAHLSGLMKHMKGAPEDATLLVRWLTELSGRYREALVRSERKQAEIAALRAQYGTQGEPVVQAEDGHVDVAALEARQKELAGALAAWSEALAREEQTEARLTSETEELDELESELESLSCQIERQNQQLMSIQSAEKYLKLAREQLSGRYLNAMQQGFGRYMKALTGEDAPVFTMDAQFRVKLRAAGVGRDSDAFNTGLRDLISLCERLSLVDAMFEGERPFLILDDPFTNLDDATMARAADLLEAVAERYQVLYLTCNSSRSLQDLETKEE